ncbi:hypothetical protein DUNSADRAFT_18378 [Dunaliella salina]|uniref:Uncharacterized protein n=1 Tax=Dunaliella salina TaxID=3046 RepID=A0ABQ7G077_DUNSA|nr:hypothetical protein DUNSADRAFT_18378 [Dunaliella salina]|eukprot:KAF5828004.1 hypothetical protein DUNSADRAFT_18378 [Dunaliella salina]
MEDIQASQLHAHPEALASVMHRLNQALSEYVGRHSFHSFACAKEVGLAIAVARGSAGITTVQAALSGSCNVPTAPAAFLLMDAAVFEGGTLDGGCFEGGLNEDHSTSTSSLPWALTAQDFKACHILPSMFADFPIEIYDFVKSLPSHDYSVVTSRVPTETRNAGSNSSVSQEQRLEKRACHDMSAAILGGLETYGCKQL